MDVKMEREVYLPTSHTNAAIQVDYVWMEEVLNIYVRIHNKTDFLCYLIERYLFSVSAFVCFCSMAEH